MWIILNTPDNITLKKSYSTGKLLSSRLLLKAGSAFFLIFFIAFMLSAPMAAQFGSFFFILFGVLVFANAPEVKSEQTIPAVPPVADTAIYLPYEMLTDTQADCQEHPDLQYVSDMLAVSLSSLEFNKSISHIGFNQVNIAALWNKIADNPVRAGPLAGEIFQA